MNSLVVLSVLFAGALAAPQAVVVGYAPAATVYTAPAAVSHQSRVDIKSSPAVVSPVQVVASPDVVASPAVVDARSVYVAPAQTTYFGGSAVSHQSRVDVKSSPAVVTEQVVQPAVVAASPYVEAVPTYVETIPTVVDARSVYVAPVATSTVLKSSPHVVAENVYYTPSVYATSWRK